MDDLQRLQTQRDTYRKIVSKLIVESPGKDRGSVLKLLAKVDKYEGALQDSEEKVAQCITTAEELENEMENSIEFQSKVSDFKVELNLLLESLGFTRQSSVSFDEEDTKSGVMSASSGNLKVKLPKLELQKFSGDPIDWPAFWDIFKSEVHYNKELSEVHKFAYLKSVLKGSAETSIAGLAVINANYGHAIELLTERYGKEEIIIHAHIDALLDLPIATDQQKVREVFDLAEKHIRGLESLKVMPDAYGIVITPLILKKFPTDIRLVISRKDKNAMWDLEILRNELRMEIEAREHSQIASSSSYSSSRKSTAEALIMQTKKFCIFCSEGHAAFDCPLPVEKRWIKAKEKKLCFLCLKAGHSSRKCRSDRRCYKCHRYHHTVLCDPTRKKAQNKDEYLKEKETEKKDAKNEEKSSAIPTKEAKVSLMNSGAILMQTASATAISGKAKQKVHLFFESGSQRSFITEKMASLLRCKKTGEEMLALVPFGETRPVEKRYDIVEVCLRDLRGKTYKVSTIVIPVITTPIIREQVSSDVLEQMAGVQLAESYDAVSESISVEFLIGLDQEWMFLNGETRIFKGGPIAMNTVFGWILRGPIAKSGFSGQKYHVSKVGVQSFDMEQIWSLESIGIKDPVEKSDKVDEEKKVLEIYEKTVKYMDQRYYVDFPQKDSISYLPDNKVLAKQRLLHLWNRRLSHDAKLLEAYDGIIREQKERGFIEDANENNGEDERVHYLSHHPVIKLSSNTTKVRIVFDASAKIDRHSPSLNDVLFKGPDFTGDLFAILLRFRSSKVAVVSDIEKAFLMVGLNRNQRDITRFLWLSDSKDWSKGLKEYRFARVPFGIISSPYLLNQTLRYHLAKEGTDLCERISTSLYVDNVVMSVDDVEQGILLYKESKEIFNKARMNLREWQTNNKELKKSIPEKDLGRYGKVKVLGVEWNTETDTICIAKPVDQLRDAKDFTKRIILKMISSIFDPHGWITPVSIKGKILLQEIWKQSKGWDNILNQDLQNQAKALSLDLAKVNQIVIPRCAEFGGEQHIELHTFVDASPKAYAAVIYVLLKEKGHVQFLCSKVRVAPLKEITLPKLELMAILIGTRLSNFVSESLSKVKIQQWMWSDSQIAIAWVNSTKELPMIVKNRVQEIRKFEIKLGYVPTKENPADLATRGITVEQLTNAKLWWSGPSWLTESEKPIIYLEESVGKFNSIQIDIVTTSKKFPKRQTLIWPRSNVQIERYSNISKVFRVTAYCKKAIAKFKSNNVPYSDLSAAEITEAKKDWDQAVQWEAFGEEIVRLTRNQNSLLIRQLKLVLDGKGYLRCKGRIDKAYLELDAEWPKLLPGSHPYTKMIIESYHKKLLHAGVSHTLAAIRNEYWIPKGRQAIKSVLSKCTTCKRWEGRPYLGSEISSLPDFRVKRSLPFEHCGVDFLGPLYARSQKVWICIFSCAVTRALYLELVNDLTTEEFLLCLRRFIAANGCPKHVISDNALTFKSAKNILDRAERAGGEDKVSEFFSNKQIKWSFNIERAPWWGGFYERMVGLVKRSLKKSIGCANLSFRELETQIKEIQSILNTRPLTYIYEDIKDGKALTPNSLCGRYQPYGTLNFDEDDTEIYKESNAEALSKKARAAEKVLETFWIQWREEYLQSLREVHSRDAKKFKVAISKIRVGDIVLIKDDLPRGRWKLAVVYKLIVGQDGCVRGASVMTAKGLLQRPLQMLYPLEVHSSEVNERKELTKEMVEAENQPKRAKRNAALKAREKIQKSICGENEAGGGECRE